MTVDAVPRKLESLEILDLLRCLPHRYPFLMVDRIIDIVGDESAIGIKNVSFNEPQFQGHFPGAPVMPGVLLLEGIAQTAGAVSVAVQGLQAPRIVYFLTIDKAKFRKPVYPGDQIRYHLRKLQRRRNVWRFRGEAMVDGTLVAEAEVSAMVVSE